MCINDAGRLGVDARGKKSARVERCSCGGKVSSTMRIDVAVWQRKRSIK
jgi:hypothetical protein